MDTRWIAIGTHHLEYGFPSTHSTNSVSMALFVFGQVHSAYSDYSAISGTTYWISCGILVLYAISIVIGRIHTGMHSFTDCGVGVALGAAIWAGYVITSNMIERWLESGSWIGKAPYSCIAFLFDKQCSRRVFSSFCAGVVVPLAGTLSSAAGGRLSMFRGRDCVHVGCPWHLFGTMALCLYWSRRQIL